MKYSLKLALALGATAPMLASARVALILSETTVIELPRSQTYLQRRPVETNFKTLKALKPSALSDEELATIPERYLSPELLVKQKEIKTRLAEKSAQVQAQGKAEARNGKKSARTDPWAGRVLISNATVNLKPEAGSAKPLALKIEDTIWIPPTAAKDDAILKPQRRLPDVEKLTLLEVDGSTKVEKEINPGEVREIHELFQNGKTQDPNKVSLLEAYRAYAAKDYATAVTLALTQSTRQPESQLYGKYLAAHALYQSGFYASASAILMGLADSKLRRSVIGMAAKSIEKTRDDSVAQTILSKISLSQIPEDYRDTFAFHFGRVLMDGGAAAQALASFEKVPANNPNYAEAQYYSGVIKTAHLGTDIPESAWADEASPIYAIRTHFENALVSAHTQKNMDLMDLTHLALARLAYQAKQFHQAVAHYNSVPAGSPYSREALFETAWALYRTGEFNRALGILHPIGSPYVEARDFPELWILRSLNYLKLCRFEEASRSANTFDRLVKTSVLKEITQAKNSLKTLNLAKPSELEEADLPPWFKSIVHEDTVIKKDRLREKLFSAEGERLKTLLENKRVASESDKKEVYDVLALQLVKRNEALGKAINPYLVGRLEDLESEYKGQAEKLEFLRFEVYSQASRYPAALERREAAKLLTKGEFLPGVFLKGHEILWRYSQEFWLDEIKGYDYFIPSECKEASSVSAAN